MKDELREFESDATSRKTATDWLMKVISGKKPAMNGSDESAVAVAEPPAPPRQASPKRVEIKRDPAPAPDFTAEDLCGAPAVPIIQVAPAAKDEITADDVCWVPVEHRLKPEPATPKLQIVPSLERDVPPAEMHEPRSNEMEITAADISRDPAPHMVAPILNGFASEPDMPEAEKEITAADIARDWVLQEMSPAPRETRDGAVLPFSYKVIQTSGSTAADGAETTAEVTAADLTRAPEFAPEAITPESILRETADIAPETAMPAHAPRFEELREPARIEVSTEIVADMPPEHVPEPVAVEPVAPPEPVAQIQEVMDPKPVEAVPEQAASTQEVPASISEEAREEIATESEIESALHRMEVSGEQGAEQTSEAAASVFARENFWEEAAGTDALARGEAAYEKPVLRNVKSQHPWSEVFGDTGQRPEGWVSAWKTLLRLGSVLPWVARALPMIESGGLADQAPGTGGLQEMRQDVSGLRLVQYEIRTTVQDHSMQLKRMEEQLGRVRESIDSKASENSELTESVRAMTKLMRLAGIGLGALLLVLIILMIVMLAHGR